MNSYEKDVIKKVDEAINFLIDIASDVNIELRHHCTEGIGEYADFLINIACECDDKRSEFAKKISANYTR